MNVVAQMDFESSMFDQKFETLFWAHMKEETRNRVDGMRYIGCF